MSNLSYLYYNHKFLATINKDKPITPLLSGIGCCLDVDPESEFVKLVLDSLLIPANDVKYLPWDNSLVIYSDNYRVTIECSPVVDFFTTLKTYCSKPTTINKSFMGLLMDNLFQNRDVFILKSVHKPQLSILTDKERQYHEMVAATIERYKTTLGHSLGIVANLQHFKCPYSLNEYHENELTKLNRALIPISRVFANIYETYPDIYSQFVKYLDKLDAQILKTEAYIKFHEDSVDATSH